MMKQSLIGLALVGMLFSAGCKSEKDTPMKSTDGETLAVAPLPLKPSDNPAIADVPLPMGFVPVNSVNRTDIHEGSRTITHIYEGRASMHDLVTYLRVNVGKYNWERVADKEGTKQSVLEFDKGREHLFIKIDQRDGYLHVTLSLVSRKLGERREEQKLGL
jgi:hypothetical protein